MNKINWNKFFDQSCRCSWHPNFLFYKVFQCLTLLPVEDVFDKFLSLFSFHQLQYFPSPLGAMHFVQLHEFRHRIILKIVCKLNRFRDFGLPSVRSAISLKFTLSESKIPVSGPVYRRRMARRSFYNKKKHPIVCCSRSPNLAFPQKFYAQIGQAWGGHGQPCQVGWWQLSRKGLERNTVFSKNFGHWFAFGIFFEPVQFCQKLVHNSVRHMRIVSAPLRCRKLIKNNQRWPIASGP